MYRTRRYRFACWIDNAWTRVIIRAGYPQTQNNLTNRLWRIERLFFWFVVRWSPK